MKRVLYRSRCAEGVGSPDVFKIIETSARNNPGRDITGFLLQDGDFFLQLLEGPPLKVEGLLAVIERDARHCDMEILFDATAEDRWFPDWAMKRLISFGGTPAMDELRETLSDKPRGKEVLDLVENHMAP